MYDVKTGNHRSRRRSKLAFCVAVLVGLLFFSQDVSAAGSSLRMRKFQRAHTDFLAEEAVYTSQVCGRNIATEINWSTFQGRSDEYDSNLYQQCDAPLSALESICRTPKGKAFVMDSVDSVECRAGSRRSVILRNGTLIYTILEHPSDDYDYILRYLRRVSE